MKTHHAIAMKTTCGQWTSNVVYTTDWRRVTCKHCRRLRSDAERQSIRRARDLVAARAECIQLAHEMLDQPVPPGFCRCCRITRLSAIETSGLCETCRELMK